MLYCENRIIALVSCMERLDNWLFFSDVHGNEIYKYDITSGIVEVLCRVEEEDTNGKNLFSHIVIFKKELVLVPRAAKHIYQVNINDGSYKCVRIQGLLNDGTDYCERLKFEYFKLFEDNLYLFGSSFPGIIKFDGNSAELHDDWVNAALALPNYEGAISFFKSGCDIQSFVYMPSCRNNNMFIFNLKSNDFKLKRILDKDRAFSDACVVNREVWLLSRRGCTIVKYDTDSDRISELEITDYRGRLAEYRYIVTFGKYVYVIPFESGRLYRITIESNDIECVIEEKDDLKMQYVVGGECLFIASQTSGVLYQFYMNGKYDMCRIILCSDAIRKNVELEKNIMYEAPKAGLLEYIAAI